MGQRGNPAPARVVLTAKDGHAVEGLFDDCLVLEECALGTTRFDRVPLSGGGNIYLTCLNVKTAVDLQIDGRGTRGFLGSVNCVTGTVGYRLPGKSGTISPDRSICFLITDEGGAYRIGAGQTVRTAGVSVTEDLLDRYLGSDVPAALRDLVLAPQDASGRCLEYTPPPGLRFIAGMMVESPLGGALRHLQLEGLALALLAMQADALDGRNRSGGTVALTRAEKAVIADARDRLLADIRNPPPLETLAAMAGLSEQRLNAGLRALFGGTAFELVRAARLEQAARQLADPARTIKEIAWDVGYQHVPNFNRAFTARFGQTPAAYARRIRG